MHVPRAPREQLLAAQHWAPQMTLEDPRSDAARIDLVRGDGFGIWRRPILAGTWI